MAPAESVAVQARTSARLVVIRATEEALDRRPDLAVAMVRAQLERSVRRRAGQPLTSRDVAQRLAIRAIDVHPVVGERLVRLWLRRARAAHEAGLSRA
jgi:hypothetical protein